MLEVRGLDKAYGGKPVLKGVSFVIGSGEKVALIGPNGAGKSTLFKIVAGLDTADNGVVSLSKSSTVGYLPQHLSEFLKQTVGEFLFSERLRELQKEFHKLEGKMQELPAGRELDKVVAHYGEVQQEFALLGGYEIESKIHKVLKGLGLDLELSSPLLGFSGGQKAKIALARLLVTEPSLLLLDEPTNHLDLESLVWLESFVKRFKGSVLVISHDRRFLDQTISRIIELDDHTHQVKEYVGTYTDYATQRQRETEKQYERYEDYKAEVKRIKESARKKQEWANKGQRGPKSKDNDKNIRNTAKERSSGVSSAGKALERRLDRIEMVQKPFEDWGVNAELTMTSRSGEMVAKFVKVDKVYGTRKVLEKLDFDLHFGERVAIFGANGSGKTTLIKLLLGLIKPDVGQVKLGARVISGYFSQEQEGLDFSATVLEEFMKVAVMYESDARSFLCKVEFTKDEVFKKIRDLSPGERARLMLAKLMIAQPNFLVLDEPTNHLDLESLGRVESAFAEYPGTMLVVSHDRYFQNRIGVTRILFLKNGRLRTWNGSLAEYEGSLAKRTSFNW